MAADLKGPLVWASNGEKIRGKQCSEDRGRGWGARRVFKEISILPLAQFELIFFTKKQMPRCFCYMVCKKKKITSKIERQNDRLGGKEKERRIQHL